MVASDSMTFYNNAYNFNKQVTELHITMIYQTLKFTRGSLKLALSNQLSGGDMLVKIA
jgi:hypothetical protein